ncbi:MAG: hypothetical protein IPH65_02565 [Dehalococcoidia bacterium]|uniref:hypothetical protein n=1 Tax=Candidatus Amarobacter glycogenicus TaxID=3140699 RepID=UPI0031363C8F|nr:hypothetical protein [Dehalococcoidia bacterium]
MRGTVLSLVLVTAGFSAALPVFEDAPVAQACSCPDCDVVRDAEVIVGGRILSWQPSEIPSPFDGAPVYLPIELDLRVDRVFKGSAPGKVEMVDFASYGNGKDTGEYQAPDRITWSGAGGACGAFDEDPRGKYIVIGFTPRYPWQANRLQVLFLGDEPSGERYEWAMARLAPLGGPYPPAAGNSAADADAATDQASNDWMFLSAIGAGFLLITLVLVLIGPVRNARHPD